MPALTLSRTSFPFLTRSGWRAPLEWTHGPLFTALLGSSVLRVGERGVSWCATCDMTTPGWGAAAERVPCLPTPDALCAARIPSLNASLVFFPSAHVRIPADMEAFARGYAAPDTGTTLGGLWAAVQHSCDGSPSNRVLVFDQREYAVSLCDLVHGRLDFVLYPQLGELAWRQRDSEDFFYSLLWTALVTVVVLFLFTRVCENISHIIRGEGRKSDWHTTLLLLLATVCSFPATARNDFAPEERVLTLMLQVYAFFYVFMLLCDCGYAKLGLGRSGKVAPTDMQPLLPKDTFNTEPAPDCAPAPADRSVNTTGALIAVLLLLTAHLQNTYETPFLSIFVIIFGARNFLKFLNLTLHHSRAASALFACFKLAVLLTDTFAFVAVLELAVRTAARSSSEYASTAAGLELLSALGGVFLYQVVASRPPAGQAAQAAQAAPPPPAP
jgi:hypothetical protein